MDSKAQLKFVRESIKKLIQQDYLDKRITAPVERKLLEVTKKRLQSWTKSLFGPKRYAPLTKKNHLGFELLEMEELGGKKFHLVVMRRQSASPKRLVCFVGHRFRADIETSLQTNIRRLFDGFGIDPIYLGTNLSAVQLLSDALERIESSDFCFFDNRATSDPSKPNVYIEAGMAYALGRPFILCNYRRESLPSDFGGLLQERYSTYRQLFSALNRRLPSFLSDNGLVAPSTDSGGPN